ncbi:MAG TPA: UrcA family protein [Sphingomicrobium sp.]
MKNPFVIAAVSAIITAGLIKAAPALAEPVAPTQTRVSVVQTADLDLNSASGQHSLQIRLAQAAREVCGTASDADLAGQNKVLACRHDAIARAAGKRDALLTAAKDGAPIAITASR